MAPLGTRPAVLALLAASACSLPRCELDDLSPGDSAASGGDDTGWLAALPVYDCPGPPEGVTVFSTVSASAVQTFASWGGPLDYYLQADGVNYDIGCRDPEGDDAVFDGSVPDAVLFTLHAYLFEVEDPIALQGEYDPDTERISGQASYLYLLFGWWREGAGYEHVAYSSHVTGSEDEVPAFCLSRVRPDRISGTAMLRKDVDPFYDPGVGSYFVAFDLREGIEEDCMGTLYDGEATEESVWDGLR